MTDPKASVLAVHPEAVSARRYAALSCTGHNPIVMWFVSIPPHRLTDTIGQAHTEAEAWEAALAKIESF
jgi:hypothetical protein